MLYFTDASDKTESKFHWCHFALSCKDTQIFCSTVVLVVIVLIHEIETFICKLRLTDGSNSSKTYKRLCSWTFSKRKAQVSQTELW